MGASRFEDLLQHVGHKIVCVTYGDPPVNAAVECETCGVVLMDYDLFDDIDTTVALLEEQLKARGIDAEESQEQLDEMVHHAASAMASDVNNNGVDSQVEFLLGQGYAPNDIVQAAGNVGGGHAQV